MNFPKNTKPWIQGGIVGVVAAMVVGFSWGGWVTERTYKKDMVTANHDGAVTALTPICVANFKAQPDAAAKIAEVSKASTWERGGIVERSGFAKMPGSNIIDSDVARACGEILGTPPKT